MIVVELTAAIDASGTTQTFYVSTDGYTSLPTDTPANTPFLPVLVDPGYLGVSAYSDARTGGATKLEVGEMILANADGALDGWLDYSFDGRPVTIRSTTVGASGAVGAYPSSFTTVITATVESVEADWKTIIIRLRDKQWKFQLPILTTRYGGTNSLPAGLDGTANDIKGKVKPRIYGKVLNAAPPCCNTSLLIYQVSDGAINSVDAVYDRGAALTVGGARRIATMGVAQTTVTFTVSGTTATTGGPHGYVTGDPVTVATSATLPTPLVSTVEYFAHVLTSTTLSLHNTVADANAGTNAISMSGGSGTHNISNNRVAAGYFDWCMDASGSYIQLGSTPSGQVTIDATQGAAAANRTTAQILDQIALAAGLTSGEISSADIIALDSANSAVVGIWLDDETTTFQQAMDLIAASASAFYGFDSTGTLRMGVLTAPTGTPVVTLQSYDIGEEIERRPPNDNALPVYRVTVNHSRIGTVQTSDIASSVTAATRAYLATQYRSEKSEDLTVKAQWLLSTEYNVTGLLTSSSDAATESARLLALFKVRRDVFDVPVDLSILTTYGLKFMDLVAIQLNRFGMNNARSFRVIGIRIELLNNRAILTVWG
jgi:hypothetical protein